MYKPTGIAHIKVYKDKLKFKLDFELCNKRYRKIYIADIDLKYNDRLIEVQKYLKQYRNQLLHLDVDIRSTVDDYWSKVQSTSRWNDRSLRDFKYYYIKYLQDMGPIPIVDLKPTHFTNLNIRLKHLSPRYMKKAYEIFRPIINLAIEDELIRSTPIKKSHIPVRNSLQEKKVILDAVDKYKTIHRTIHLLYKDNPHHRAFFLFGFNGRRLSEVLNLQWNDINFNDSTYIVKKSSSKVNQDMSFKLPRELIDALSELDPSNGLIFSSRCFRKQYIKIRNISNIQEFSYHWMRNLSVSALSTMGVDTIHLSSMLGHTDTSTLKKYLSLQRASSSEVTNNISEQLLR